MRQYEKSLRLGAAIVLCALIVRLFSEGLVPKTAALLNTPGIRDFLIYLETGRAVRSSSVWELSYAPESSPAWIPETTAPVQEEASLPEETGPAPFTQEEGEGLKLYNTSGLQADPGELLLRDTPFPEGEGPRVLIYSTHSTESYTQGQEPYPETAPYRTLEKGCNMLSLGKALEEALLDRGIPVLRDETIYDYPSYNSAYGSSRKSLRAYLRAYPSIVLALDLHRDAADTGSGQLRTLAQTDGENSAQLMLVVGTDARGLVHPNWEENLSVGLKLQALLERLSPGLTRPTCLRPQRFNQDLSPGCLIVEIGGAGNTRQEALRTIPVLAQAIEELLEMG